MTVVPRPRIVSPVRRARSAGRCRQTESVVWPGVATTWISQPDAVIVSPGARPPSPSRYAGSEAWTGAPVIAANVAAPSAWSGWEWVSRIPATRWPADVTWSWTRRRWDSSSGPGSTTTAWAEPGSAIIQVFVPSSVIGEGFGASTHRARAVPVPSMDMSAGPLFIGYGHPVPRFVPVCATINRDITHLSCGGAAVRTGRSSQRVLQACRNGQPRGAVGEVHLGDQGGDPAPRRQGGRDVAAGAQLAERDGGGRHQRDLAPLGGGKRRTGFHPGGLVRLAADVPGMLAGWQGGGKEPGVVAPLLGHRGDPARPGPEQVTAEHEPTAPQ